MDRNSSLSEVLKWTVLESLLEVEREAVWSLTCPPVSVQVTIERMPI